MRRRLSDERRSVTHRFVIAGHKGYLIVGLYEDGRPGELFVRMAKEGETLGTLLDQWATAFSIGLQSGVPLRIYVEKFSRVRFEPSGPTNHPEIHFAGSPIDYIARWLGLRFAEFMDGEKEKGASKEPCVDVVHGSSGGNGASDKLVVQASALVAEVMG